MESQPSNKKLRILCLHGYSNSTDLFNYMAKQFFELYKDKADFYVPEGLFPSKEPVPRTVIELKMSLPLKSWFRLDDWVFDDTKLPPKDLFGFD
jgi:hypothetical protein